MTLPRLRWDLDILPSPIEDRPGLLLRDPMRYSDAVLVIPWQVAPCLDLFDGEHEEADLAAELVRVTGQLDTKHLREGLITALRDSAFLMDETFERVRSLKCAEFAAAPVREASHAGGAYPDDPTELAETMRGYLDPGDRADGSALLGIASPHASPFAAWRSYRAAYRHLAPDLADKTFIVLGTSHYGESEKFGLTRKPYETPLGATSTDETLVKRLAARAASGVTEEDYAHAVEHSIEFQVLFLQWVYGPRVKVVPILCGAFARSVYVGGLPEDTEGVRSFLGELGELAAREAEQLVWVLGIDMAHIGTRYGDRFAVQADDARMREVAARDQVRSARVTAGDTAGFWDLVQQRKDDLRWCGSSPLYTFLKTVAFKSATVESYEQWNIDEQSVVSFAGMRFGR